LVLLSGNGVVRKKNGVEGPTQPRGRGRDRRSLVNALSSIRSAAVAPLRALAATLLVLASCARESAPPPANEAPEPAAPAQPSAPPSVPPAEPATPPADRWTSGIVDVPAELAGTPPIPVVSALRTGTHEGFDRVTIELAGAGVPGYHAEYVDKPLHQCGSGNEVFPVGQGWLEIRLEPAQAHTDEGAPTLPAREIEATGRLLRRIYVTCDFEAVVSLVLAVDSPNEFQIVTLRNPTRIVVDVRH
jgi:hypothetical protein